MLNIHHTTLGLIPSNRVALQQVSVQISLGVPLLNITAPLLRSHLPEVYNSHEQKAQSFNWEGVGGGGPYLSNVAVGWTHRKAQGKLSLCIPQRCIQGTEVHLKPFFRQKQEVNFMPQLLQPQVLTEQEVWWAPGNRNIFWLGINRQHDDYTDCISQLLWTQYGSCIQVLLVQAAGTHHAKSEVIVEEVRSAWSNAAMGVGTVDLHLILRLVEHTWWCPKCSCNILACVSKQNLPTKTLFARLQETGWTWKQ